MQDDLTPNTQSNDTEVTDEQFTKVGERLAYLLAAASLPEDVKDAWVALVPEMTIEQMDRFAKALEENIAGTEGPELERLTQGIKEAKEVDERETKAIMAKANASLEEIEKMISEG